MCNLCDWFVPKTLDPCLRRDDEKETMSIIRASLPLMWESSVLCVTYVTGLYPKTLDYEIHPCISPFGPAKGCSLKLMDSHEHMSM